MSNITSYIVNESYGNVVDCGTIITDFSSKIDWTVKSVSIAMFLLLVFEWWSINKVINGKLTHDEKQKYISFILVFIHSLLLLGSFILVYWLVLSGLDF